MRLFFMALLILAQPISANNTKSLYRKTTGSLPAGTKVVIVDYTTADGGIFKGFNPKLDGEGDFFFRAEHLAKALKVPYKNLFKGASKMKGEKITLKKDLLLVQGGVQLENVVFEEKKK